MIYTTVWLLLIMSHISENLSKCTTSTSGSRTHNMKLPQKLLSADNIYSSDGLRLHHFAKIKKKFLRKPSGPHESITPANHIKWSDMNSSKLLMVYLFSKCLASSILHPSR